MTTDEKIKIVTETVRLYKEFSAASDAFCKAAGATLDKGVLDAAWRCVEYHRRHTERIIEDKAEWLDWFIYENDCGEKELKVKYSNRWRAIRTPKDLVRVMESEK